MGSDAQKSDTWQVMSAAGSRRSKMSASAATPSSSRITAPTPSATATVAGAVSVSKAAASASAVSVWMGMGGGPTPARRQHSPQKCWSPKNGQTSVGRPRLNPAATVPAPPWWTTARQWGMSQLCGQGPIVATSGDVRSPSIFDHELCTMTRVFDASAASKIRS